ncbi:4Fe-4S cluster-binding domain-containing protein [Actinomadura rugatobispora]|uniref:4Fe-4S cluster-binding domain-containing protein n=1 Tax=Actinomadura rugatobispora TaxID=1994 RepID=A0ABW1AGK6_9ACTN
MTPPGSTGAPRSVPWRVHGVLARSRANGPGLRFTVWSQGCSLGCPGCFNPETHRPEGPVRTAGELAAAALAAAGDIEGVTLTGGEPLEQPAAVAAFCAEVTARGGLGVVGLTGFTREEIEADPGRLAAVADADMVVAGRYNPRLHLGAGLRGSANKMYWARTGRYRAADFEDVPETEMVIAPDGGLVVTGMRAATAMAARAAEGLR